MLEDTIRIRKEINAVDTMKGKLAVLHNAYRGKRCFVLSCGPSLGTVAPDELRAALRDELVVTVKQAYDVVGNIADFHLLNSTSFKQYDYGHPRPIVMLERGPRDAPIWGCRPDLRFLVNGTDSAIPIETQLSNRLSVRENFDD